MKLLFNLSIVVFLSIFFFSCNENSDNIIHDLPIYTLDASDMVYPTNIMHFSQDFTNTALTDEFFSFANWKQILSFLFSGHQK